MSRSKFQVHDLVSVAPERFLDFLDMLVGVEPLRRIADTAVDLIPNIARDDKGRVVKRFVELESTTDTLDFKVERILLSHDAVFDELGSGNVDNHLESETFVDTCY